jgi:hypothetical protein
MTQELNEWKEKVIKDVCIGAKGLLSKTKLAIYLPGRLKTSQSLKFLFKMEIIHSISKGCCQDYMRHLAQCLSS